MARGWESKAIEDQQQEADRRKAVGPELSPEARARQQEADTLRLALAQAQAELGAACRAAHRDMLRLRIAALEDALARVSRPDQG
jgi:hypothetical protein